MFRQVGEEIDAYLVGALGVSVVDLGLGFMFDEDIHAVVLLIASIFFAIIFLELLKVCGCSRALNYMARLCHDC